MTAKSSKYSFLEAKTKLEALCAYQERCSFDLDNKLKNWGVDYEDRNRLLAHLIEHNFLNEERFAEAFVSGKINIKRWGRIKIIQHLKAKRISKYSIDKAINAIDQEHYLTNLTSLAERKWNLIREEDQFKRKAKLTRYLAAKGYESDLIYDVIGEIN